ncbi:MAG: citrate synthase [Pseudonocardiales bacterium]|nr:citrate synthase [Pseudonocardiales bacterium]
MAIGSELGQAHRDRVTVRGHDLTGDLLGTVRFADMVSLLLRGELPTPDESRMIDALIVVLVEHGLVKPSIVARMVYSNAPESMQAAVAAALLGAGSKHLGSSEHCARVLVEACEPGADAATVAAAAAAVVESAAASNTYIPGIGHRTHAGGDPRADRLFEIARETGVYGSYCRLVEEIARAAGARRDRLLPVNVTGAIAGIALDMGFRWEVCRAFALIGRTLGAVAQIQEEIDAPIADEVKDLVVAAARETNTRTGRGRT